MAKVGSIKNRNAEGCTELENQAYIAIQQSTNAVSLHFGFKGLTDPEIKIQVQGKSVTEPSPYENVNARTSLLVHLKTVQYHYGLYHC